MLATELLCNRRDLMPLVSSWLLGEWPQWYGAGGPGDLQRDIQELSASPGELPIGIVVFADGIPVGFGALKAESIPSHAHLSPWAAAGFVLPSFRGKGIGATLLQALVAQARTVGFQVVYCGTSTAASLLTRSGWQWLESVTHAGKPLCIYRSGA
jgi:GNAT superfamily N-acetyltransferase